MCYNAIQRRLECLRWRLHKGWYVHNHRTPLYLSDEELQLLSNALELHLQGLEHVTPSVCEDPSIGDWGTLLEVTADTAREADVLKSLKERIDVIKSG